MIKNKLLQKYFLLAVIIVILFVVLGFFLSGFIARALREPKQMAQDQKQSMPPLFMAKIIDNLNYQSKTEAVKMFMSWHEDKMSPQLVLLDQTGQVVFPQNANFKIPKEKISLADLNKLTKPYEYFFINQEMPKQGPPAGMPVPPGPGFMIGGPPVGPPPGPPPGGGMPPDGPGGPGGPSGPGGNQNFMRMMNRIPVILLAGPERHFLMIMPPQMNDIRPFQPMTTSEKLIPFLGFGSLVLSLLIGIGVTLFLIYISVFKKIRQADDVISELQRGNLKARFKVIRKDEFGEAMLRFNKMADEIEKLVEQMKFVELARTKLLQELAHDLRTPIAAMKSLLETLESKESVLNPQTKKEIIALSLRETYYFEHLIEDLLLLSQVSEPNYGSSQQEQISLKELLTEEVDDQVLRIQNEDNEKKINFLKDIQNYEFLLPGNRVLLRRMLKNIFNNASSFAKSTVNVQFKQSASGVEIVIEDDGPGFTAEQLQSFGERKMSRQVIREKGNHERISIGLGSVVIKKICDLHRGELKVENVQNLSQSKTGARLTLKFKSI